MVTTGKIDGVILTTLRRIENPRGDILHALKKSEPEFCGFGEAYFSLIRFGEVKGWKQHLVMTLNLVVPVGEVRFLMCDAREGGATKNASQEVTLSIENYARLTVPPCIWVAFEGRSKPTSLILNVANHEHDPGEALTATLEEIDNPWF